MSLAIVVLLDVGAVVVSPVVYQITMPGVGVLLFCSWRKTVVVLCQLAVRQLGFVLLNPVHVCLDSVVPKVATIV